MSGAPNGSEIEIKLRLASAADGLRKLAAAGFAPIQQRSFERNTLFDDKGLSLRDRGQLIRLRRYAGKNILTYKGPGSAQAGTVAGSFHKSRPELETEVADEAPLIAAFTAAGLHPVLRYEKYRTVFARGERAGLALLDETPIGTFLELEGSPEWIDRIAAELGFSVEAYITKSYLRLHEEDSLSKGKAPADMVFEDQENPDAKPA